MSRKHPRSHKQPAANPAKGTPREAPLDVVGEADNHLAKGRYREAIEAYKKLLKQERRPEWLDGLADAYTGRAQALADKAMRREAITLWQNRAELCGKPLWEGPYADWMIAEGKLTEVLAYLSRCHAGSAPKETLATLEAQLAPALLAADPSCLARLPEDTPLVRHHASALAALTAFGEADTAAFDAALAAIPFRSPYRDLRPLLKAMRQLETDLSAARAAIARMPADGPFERLAAPVRVAALPAETQLATWAKLSPTQQRAAAELMGVPAAQLPLLQALAAAGSAAEPTALFDLLIRHARLLSAAVTRRLWRQLAPWSPRRIDDSLRVCGPQPHAVETSVRALADEIKGYFLDAEDNWEIAAQQFAHGGSTEGQLQAALILRHRALELNHLSRDGTLDEAGAALLTRSLEFDVYDRETHVRLIAHWRQHNDLKKARARLDFALTYFPDDTAILAEAVATALAGGAFKKAVASARRLLALDPLNPQVRLQVGHAHLSHAGKQIVAGKTDAARNEIDEAAEWLSAPNDRSRMLALRAWTYPAGSPERQSFAREASAGWGGGLVAGWRLLREAQEIFPRGKPAQLLQDADIDGTRPLLWADLIALVGDMETAAVRADRRGLDPLSPWRKAIEQLADGRAINALPEATETLRICEALSRHHEYGLLEKFANKGRQRWPQQPVFVYHAVAARFEKHLRIVSERDYDDLESAYQHAREAGDHKLMNRIDAVFDADNPKPKYSTPDVSKISNNGTRAMLEIVLQNEGEEAILNVARNAFGASLVKEIEKSSGGQRAVFMERLIDALAIVMGVNTVAMPPFGSPYKPKKSPRSPKGASKPALPGQGNLFDD